MPANEEELELQHTFIGRPESPTSERTARLAIEAAFSQLISRKLLYQKVVVDLSTLAEALNKEKVAADAQRLIALRDEVAARPWQLQTRHQGDDPGYKKIFAAAKAGTQPIGTPAHALFLHFYAPAVQLECAVCKGERTFIALQASYQFNLEHPYPRPSSQGHTEQVYTVYYRCEACRKFMYTVLVRREEMRLHLCGYAPRRIQKSKRKVPKNVELILCDAVNAVAEGDLYAGFYHLRTMIEHFAKLQLNAPLDSRERGEDLLSRYAKSLPATLAQTLPSLAQSYDALSKRVHSRSGEIEEFDAHLEAVCDHIEGVTMLRKYAASQTDGQHGERYDHL